MSAVSAAIFITLGLLGLTFLMAVFGGGIIVILIVVYLVGAVKLTKAIGSRISTARTTRRGIETGLRVVKLTRRVAGVMIANTLIRKVAASTHTPNNRTCVLERCCFHTLHISMTRCFVPHMQPY